MLLKSDISIDGVEHVMRELIDSTVYLYFTMF